MKNLIFLGSVNSGKSTICGQLLVLFGDKSNFKDLSFYTDDIGERERNMTVNVKYKSLNDNITIIDSPGHDYLFVSAIPAIFQANVAVLVVNINKLDRFINESKDESKDESINKSLNESDTKRFLYAITLFKLPTIILMNQMDKINWDKDKYNNIYDLVKKKIPLLIDIIPCCGLTGEGIITKSRISPIYLVDILKKIEAEDLKNRNEMEDYYQLVVIKPSSKKDYGMAILKNGYLSNVGFNKLKTIDEEEIVIQRKDKSNSHIFPGEIVKFTSLKLIPIGTFISSKPIIKKNKFQGYIKLFAPLLTIGQICQMRIHVIQVKCIIKRIFVGKEKTPVKFLRKNEYGCIEIETEVPIYLYNYFVLFNNLASIICYGKVSFLSF
jgi:translation elongation factor EF-1alpha